MRNLPSLPVILTAILYYAPLLHAQEPVDAQNVVVRPFPSHAFGRVLHDQKLSHTFWILNRGRDTVTVAHVRSSCGCTAAMVENARITPGDSVALSVSFTPPRPSHGQVTKSVAVFLDRESRPRFQVSISADIISELDADSSKRILGTLAAGRPRTVPVRLRDSGTRALEVHDVQSTLTIEHRSADGTPAMITVGDVVFDTKEFNLEPGAERTVMVTFTPHETGRLMGSVVFIATYENREVEFTGDIGLDDEGR
jgi:hypothetical protein